MHLEAYAWVAKHATTDRVTVLDIGGRNINGTVRDLFPNAESYTALDIRAGDGVDIVANAATWAPTGTWDVVVCCEVFEHTDQWPAICLTAFKALRPGGVFIATMAGPGRAIHSGVDGGPFLYPGEQYGNVHGFALRRQLEACGFLDITVDEQVHSSDTRAAAVTSESGRGGATRGAW